MRGRDAALAAMTAIAGFLIVGVVVTEASADAVEFSLFIGIPAGLVAGFAAFAAVYRGLASPSDRTQRGSLAAGAFGTAFLLLLVVAAAGLDVRNTVALVVAAVGGVIVAMAVYARAPS